MQRIVLFLSILWLYSINGFSGKLYMDRYSSYSTWSENLALKPSQEFLSFIASDLPLANKLREKWLYFLAQHKDWQSFSLYYKPSSDLSLQCFSLRALYSQGKIDESMREASKLWLTPNSMPPACKPLFDIFIKSKLFSESLIYQRLSLALDAKNINLALYLVSILKGSHLKDIQSLNYVHMNPRYILKLNPGKLQSLFYLYGLKKLVSININQALAYWKRPLSRLFLSKAQNQNFISYVAIYKAVHNQDDAKSWFAKIEKPYSEEIVEDWQLRLVLKQKDWKRLINLIRLIPNKQNPCWQYWLARALEITGELQEAKDIYHSLAANRHYYGFLANLHLKQKFTLQDESVSGSLKLLSPYKTFTTQIKNLHTSKQSIQASRMLSDFVLELPKEDTQALVYWLDSVLHWYGKSVSLAESKELANQLRLRFPMPYSSLVNSYAKSYLVPHELIYAIMRQESGFREDVCSTAGAQGLMQLMPSTALNVSKKEKILCKRQELRNSQKNIRIAIAYLKQLLKQFHQQPILAIAAYNAGPGQVRAWLKNYHWEELDLWIETIPWRETRNYVKNVLSYYAVYQYRLRKLSNFESFIMQPLSRS